MFVPASINLGNLMQRVVLADSKAFIVSLAAVPWGMSYLMYRVQCSETAQLSWFTSVY